MVGFFRAPSSMAPVGQRSLISKTKGFLRMILANTPGIPMVNGPDEAMITSYLNVSAYQMEVNENAKKEYNRLRKECLLLSLIFTSLTCTPSIFRLVIKPFGMRSDLSYMEVTTVTSAPAAAQRRVIS